MKYIDADKLIEEIDKKWKELADKNVKVGGGKWDGEISTYLSVLRLIDSLQQEQPEVQNGKFVFPKYLYARTKDNKTIDMSYVPQDMTAVEYIRNNFVEQEPEVDLEKEVASYFEGLWPGMETAEQCNTKMSFTPVAVMKLVKHVYKLGKNSK